MCTATGTGIGARVVDESARFEALARAAWLDAIVHAHGADIERDPWHDRMLNVVYGIGGGRLGVIYEFRLSPTVGPSRMPDKTAEVEVRELITLLAPYYEGLIAEEFRSADIGKAWLVRADRARGRQQRVAHRGRIRSVTTPNASANASVVEHDLLEIYKGAFGDPVSVWSDFHPYDDPDEEEPSASMVFIHHLVLRGSAPTMLRHVLCAARLLVDDSRVPGFVLLDPLSSFGADVVPHYAAFESREIPSVLSPGEDETEEAEVLWTDPDPDRHPPPLSEYIRLLRLARERLLDQPSLLYAPPSSAPGLYNFWTAGICSNSLCEVLGKMTE